MITNSQMQRGAALELRFSVGIFLKVSGLKGLQTVVILLTSSEVSAAQKCDQFIPEHIALFATF